jgi:hypothetical protein
MRRRSGAGGKPLKTRQRKLVSPMRRNLPKAVRRSEALARQTATSEILRGSISASVSCHDLRRAAGFTFGYLPNALQRIGG